MRGPLITLSVACFSVMTASARIGDTEEQIETRYGNAVAELPAHPTDAGLTKCYSSAGYLIAVTYRKDKSVREVLTKVDNSKISPTEIYKLLEARASGSAWTVQELTGPTHVTAGVLQWRNNDDRSRVAIYDSQTRALFITTQQFINLTNAKKRTTGHATGERLGSRGIPLRNLSSFDKSNATLFRRNQAQPAATPAK